MFTVAVGDQRNDLEMLQWAARGVAMGNAAREVEAVAHEVTGHVDEDGLVPVVRSSLPRPDARVAARVLTGGSRMPAAMISDMLGPPCLT